MSEGPPIKSPAALWKEQPEEAIVMDAAQIMNRRTALLHASTRGEVWMSLGAAVLLLGVMAWRFAPYIDNWQMGGFAAVLVWAAVCLARARGRIRTDGAAAMADPGVAFYRRELERRRDHLRDGWLWHGPLLLALLLLARTWIGQITFRGAGNVAPLLALLLAWTVYATVRRRRQANELQREIDELQRGQ